MTTILVDGEIGEGRVVEIAGAELRYVTRVRRLGAGDTVELRDSSGRRFEGIVERSDRRSAVVTVTGELGPGPIAAPVTVVTAVPKRNIMDDVVRKLSELGVQRLAPVVTARSVVDPGPARIERWRRIAAESVRQCGRDLPMRIDGTGALPEALAGVPTTGTRLILHNGGGREPLGRIAARGLVAPVTVCVGPEGGFTDDEVGLAVGSGFRVAGLGPLILRVETAAIAAAAVAILFLFEADLLD